MALLVLTPIIYAACLLQIGLTQRWQIAGAGPDLLALTAVLGVVKSRDWHGLTIAAVLGLVSDLNSTAPLGVGMAIYSVIGYGIVWWRRQVKLDGLAGQIAAIWSGITSVAILELIASACFGQSTPALHTAIERTAVVGLYT